MQQKEAVKAHYQADAEEYDREFYKSEKAYPPLRYRHNYMYAMTEAIDLPPDAQILDIGCGPGEMVMDLVKEKRFITGIDISEEMIRLAQERLKERPQLKDHVALSTGDIEALEFEDDSLDLIICSGVVEYLEDDVKWAKELTRTIKSGGYLIINVTNKYCVRKWTEPLIVWMKNSKLIRNFMAFVKVKILGKDRLHEFPFKPRMHGPGQFDRYLDSLGFEKVSHNYFDMAVMVAPFDTLFGFIMQPIRKWMERFSSKNMILNGTGYIVCVRKK